MDIGRLGNGTKQKGVQHGLKTRCLCRMTEGRVSKNGLGPTTLWEKEMRSSRDRRQGWEWHGDTCPTMA